jgi:hypothetical protein
MQCTNTKTVTQNTEPVKVTGTVNHFCDVAMITLHYVIGPGKKIDFSKKKKNFALFFSEIWRFFAFFGYEFAETAITSKRFKILTSSFL